MKHRFDIQYRIAIIVLMLFCAGLAAGCKGSKKFMVEPPPLRAIPPIDNAITGWIKSGEPTIALDYTELSVLLGSDAARLIEGNVTSAIFQTYQSTNGSGKIKLQIYRMWNKREAVEFYQAIKSGDTSKVEIEKMIAREYIRDIKDGQMYVMEFVVHDIVGVVKSNRTSTMYRNDVRKFVEAIEQTAHW